MVIRRDVDKTRQSLRESSSEILYEDERYMVGKSSIGEDEHYLLVNDTYAVLGRGILNELAMSKDKSRLASTLRMVSEWVSKEISTNDISLEELGWVLTKALLKCERDYSGYLWKELRNVQKD